MSSVIHRSTISWILITAVITLSVITVSVTLALLIGLFVGGVEQKDIFSIIGPSINTIIGAFVGLLGGLTLNGHAPTKQHDESKPNE